MVILNFSCGPNWAGADGYSQFYNILLMIFGFFFPTMILSITNVTVLRTSNKVNHRCFQRFGLKRKILLVYLEIINDTSFIVTLFFSKKDGVEQIVLHVQGQPDILPSKMINLMREEHRGI